MNAMIRKRINAVQICRHPRQDSNLRWLGNSKYVMTTKMLLSPLLMPQNNPLQMLGTFERRLRVSNCCRIVKSSFSVKGYRNFAEVLGTDDLPD